MEAGGMKGRFKASALVNSIMLEKRNKMTQIPVEDQEQQTVKYQAVKISEWHDVHTGDVIATQVLLSILGAPKPNKRDVNGYYNKDNGMIKGAKTYLHGNWTLNRFTNFISKKINAKGEDYSHKLRNYSVVCREGLKFKGTLGAENCSVEEIAALMLVLDRRVSNHGFKIGMGKSLGLGSMISEIRKIWFRSSNNMEWKSVEVSDNNDIPELSSELPEAIRKAFNELKETRHLLQKLNDINESAHSSLEYPPPGHKYWREASNRGL